MNRRSTPPVWALPALAALLATAAHANPAARVRAFQKLPDWTGVWNEAAYTPDAGGNLYDPRVFALAFGHPPYRPEFEAQYQARLKQPRAPGDGPGCQMDFPSVLDFPTPLQFTVTPEETIVTSSIGATRHIYTDGAPHTPEDEIVPSLMGDSIGRWEGETLVVDTIARRAGPLRFFGVVAFSEKARFTERIRRLDRDTLEDRFTVEDPVTLTRPWTVVLKFTRVAGVRRLAPYECDQARP